MDIKGKKLPLKINDKIELYLNNKEGSYKYKTSVQDIRDGYIYLLMPLGDGWRFIGSKGDLIKCYLYAETCLYEFNSVIKFFENEGNVENVVIEFPNICKKRERRGFFRLHLLRDIYYNDIDIYNKTGRLYKGIMRDISAGGVRFVGKEEGKFDENNIIFIKFDLNKDEDRNKLFEGNSRFEIKARIVRKMENEGKEFACEFINLSEEERERLIKIIFKLQRKIIDKV